ncbi:hypothetical protein [Hyalangium versicolor]|uniref:hypothetical protein n=1 Tax=Hyalangium versicolor TaxID=2861190 RepID=UPI001CCD2B5A|nr:hypothetical protein [Hyalangium versicolor]
MEELTEVGLLHLARQYYPTGFPVEKDEYLPGGGLPYQRTPEHARWRAAWDKAMAWPDWQDLRREMRREFGNNKADCTQPWGPACRRCCVYVECPLPDGTQRVLRVAAAASILTPLYLTYCTTEVVRGRDRLRFQFSFEPTEEVRETTARLAALVERVLGYQRFPLHFARVPVHGIRIEHVPMGREPTLLDALFDDEDDLANLP